MKSIAAFILTKRASFAQKVVETRCTRLGCRQPQSTGTHYHLTLPLTLTLELYATALPNRRHMWRTSRLHCSGASCIVDRES